jgi:hypothetical protein
MTRIDWDTELEQAGFRQLRQHLENRPHQLNALANLYWEGELHIKNPNVWDALYRRGLVNAVDGQQPMMDSLTEYGLAFARWYTRTLEDERRRRDDDLRGHIRRLL